MIWISPHNQQKKHQGHFSWFMAVIHDPPRPHLWGSASRRGFRWIDPTPTPRNQAWGSEHHKTRTLRSRIHHKYWKYHVKRVNVCICMCVIHHIIYIDIVYIYYVYIYILCIYIYTYIHNMHDYLDFRWTFNDQGAEGNSRPASSPVRTRESGLPHNERAKQSSDKTMMRI